MLDTYDYDVTMPPSRPSGDATGPGNTSRITMRALPENRFCYKLAMNADKTTDIRPRQ